MNSRRLSTLAAVWLSRSLLGWLFSLPFIAVIADSGVSGLLEGDRTLFEPGGLLLAELARASGSRLGATLLTTWPYLLAAFALCTLPQGALFHQALVPASDARAAFRAAGARFGSLVAVAAAELVAKLATGIVVVLVDRVLAQAPGVPLRAMALVLCAALLLAGVLGASIVSDVRRAFLFSDPELRGAAAGPTWAHVRAHAVPLFGAYLLRTGLATLLIALAARLVELADVGRPGAFRVFLVLLVHQAVVALITGLDAAWVRRVVLPLQPPASFL